MDDKRRMYEAEMRSRKPAPPASSASAAAAVAGGLPSARRVPAITNPSIMDAGRRMKQSELRESLDQQMMMKKAVQSLDRATSDLLEQQVELLCSTQCKSVTLCRS
jgi:hypothetical protein